MSAPAPAGRIGPNAVIRLGEAVAALEGTAASGRLFAAAGLAAYALEPPRSMLPEQEVSDLHHVLRRQFGDRRAASASWIAGQRTADYLLAHRIPLPVQRLLRLLPRRLGAALLLKAIGAHAWTFAGSSRFSWSMGRVISLSFENCPLCRGDHAASPCCSYYAATFERLFQALIAPDACVRETACIATGAGTCHFEISY